MAKKNLAKRFPKLIRAILQSPFCNASVVELVFIKIAGIDSATATFPPRSFSHNYVKIFSRLLLKYLTWAPFLVKLWAVHYRVTGQKFTKTLTDRRLFSQIILFKTANFGIIFRRESLPVRLSLLVVKLLSSHFSLNYILYWNKPHHRRFLGNSRNFINS